MNDDPSRPKAVDPLLPVQGNGVQTRIGRNQFKRTLSEIQTHSRNDGRVLQSIRDMSWLTLFLLSSACVRETNQSMKNATLRCEPSAAAIRAAIQRLIAADNARDLPQVISMYTQDVVFLPPTGEEVTGRQAVEARYQRLFATQAPRIRMEIAETRLSDDWAFVRGVTQGTLTSVSSGEVTIG